jgi:very-short-patch-repair endonuclease
LKNKIIPYNSKLRAYAKELRKNITFSEILLWKQIKGKALGIEFHRQVPMLNYIDDFYSHEIMLAIEIDGNSHDYKQKYDDRRQYELEQYGVTFLRLTDADIKQQMFSVLLVLEDKIEMLRNKMEGHPPTPLQRGSNL